MICVPFSKLDEEIYRRCMEAPEVETDECLHVEAEWAKYGDSDISLWNRTLLWNIMNRTWEGKFYKIAWKYSGKNDEIYKKRSSFAYEKDSFQL